MKDDLISKQTAINAKQEFRNPNVIRDTESRTAYDRTYANGWNDCNKAWINAIEKLPPAQPGIKEMAVDIGYLRDWYQSSVLDDEWPDRYIEEVYHDFYLIPKQGGERDE